MEVTIGSRRTRISTHAQIKVHFLHIVVGGYHIGTEHRHKVSLYLGLGGVSASVAIKFQMSRLV